MKKVKYIRISSGSQSIYRQQSSNEKFSNVYVDVISGTVPMNHRPEGSKMMEEILSGSVSELHTTNVDRLGRNTLDILNTLQICSEQKVNVCIESLGISSLLPNGKENHIFQIVITILAQISQMEREAIRDRCRSGRDLAIARGVKFGRKEGRETVGKFLQKPLVEQIIKTIKRKPNLTIREVALINECSTKLVLKVKKLTSELKY